MPTVFQKSIFLQPFVFLRRSQDDKKAIKNYPNISIFHNLLGLALSNIGKFYEAKIILEKGHKINKDDLAIINNLANANKNIFEYELAEKLYQLSMKLI